MKHIVTIFVLSTCSALAFPDFRWSKWGDTKAQVQLVEPEEIEPLEDDEDIWAGVTTVASTDMFLLYSFVGDKLIKSSYLLKNTFETASPYWSIYFKLEGLLNAKYGLGVRYHGSSAAIATWTTPTTTIWLVYDSGASYPVSLSYTSREFGFLTDPEFEMAEY